MTATPPTTPPAMAPAFDDPPPPPPVPLSVVVCGGAVVVVTELDEDFGAVMDKPEVEASRTSGDSVLPSVSPEKVVSAA